MYDSNSICCLLFTHLLASDTFFRRKTKDTSIKIVRFADRSKPLRLRNHCIVNDKYNRDIEAKLEMFLELCRFDVNGTFRQVCWKRFGTRSNNRRQNVDFVLPRCRRNFTSAHKYSNVGKKFRSYKYRGWTNPENSFITRNNIFHRYFLQFFIVHTDIALQRSLKIYLRKKVLVARTIQVFSFARITINVFSLLLHEIKIFTRTLYTILNEKEYRRISVADFSVTVHA